MTVCYRIFGIVQGVGFRPFTAVTAAQYGIRGTVANKGSYVEIIAQGEPERLSAFADAVSHTPPERAVILDLEQAECAPGEYPEFDAFTIIESEHEPGDIFVSPDIATCDKCRAELFDPQNRRYLHPFINCTQCGPRLTILDRMPYDRARTSMAEFPMCRACADEYFSPATRRFDAQPVCCNACGPGVCIIGSELRGGDAITAARQAIAAGKIIAVKGIGGFHLCCDAKNSAAVRRLRTRKKRPTKPFALMLRDMETVRRECRLQPGQEAWLTGWQKPILLLQKGENMSVCEEIAPDNETVGVMLPYAPLQMLLFDYPDGIRMTDCLVMTSGNARGAPICRSDADAQKEIAGFCDLMLSHDRKIRIRADDSVCDWLFGKPYMIRRSRGFAPLPVMLRHAGDAQVLAIGGELKNSFCIAKNGLLYASPYIGDTADIRTVSALRESVGRMCDLLEAEPQAVVCDTHPLYSTVTVAEEIAGERGIPLLRVQHHYAHILSCMAENRCTEPVLGLSLDGTGYGDDGTVWGGELLLCNPQHYRRIGHIRPFLQVGGDASAREGWRIAASLLGDPAQCEALGICTAQEATVIGNMARLQVNTVTSTSAGRIFDAVSAVLGIRRTSTFEGEASTALMAAAERYEAQHGGCPHGLPAAVRDGVMDTTALVREIAAKRLSGGDAGALAYAFHSAMAELLLTACIGARAETGVSLCALSGGVFQNRLLMRMLVPRLKAADFTVLRHSLFPPNDGGICIGQALYGIRNAE